MGKLSAIDRSILKRMASKYIWWKSPDDAADMPNRVIAQVMDIGDYADVRYLADKPVAAVRDLPRVPVISRTLVNQDISVCEKCNAVPCICGDDSR